MSDRIARLSAVLVALLLAAPSIVDAQGNDPRRPALTAEADTNDWMAYYDAGSRWLESNPKKAADAFHWASKLDPTRPEPFYGRRVALLIENPRRLVRYWRGDRSTVRSREIQRIDSLYLHALTLNPFFYQRLDRIILRKLITEIAEDLAPGSGMSSGELRILLDQSINSSDLALRAWAAYAEGDFDRAEQLYGQAMGETRNRRAKASLMTDRARLYFQRDKSERALADLTAALAELRRTDRKDLIYVYESKALAEQGLGMVQKRLGNTTAAREAFARSLQEDLSYFPAHVQMAMLALDSKDTVAALSEMDLAVQIKPDDAGLRYMYGFTLSEVGRHADSEEQLNRAIEMNEVYAAPRIALAKVLEAQGKPQDALTQYRSFLSLATRGDPRRREAQARVTALAAPGSP
jgi:tetratricopeptide (TPR) repeat protein